MIYKRGELYWYKFMWQGKLVRESSKQGNDKVARQMEAADRDPRQQVGLVAGGQPEVRGEHAGRRGLDNQSRLPLQVRQLLHDLRRRQR